MSEEKKENENEKEKGSFWTTIPGILTGIAAMIAAVAALYTALDGDRFSPSDDPTATPPPVVTVTKKSPPLGIDITHVASNVTYQVDELRHMGVIWMDAGYRFTHVPEELEGMLYIRTALADKFNDDRTLLKFRVNKPVDVYVAYDDRYKRKPVWLDDFEETEHDLEFEGPGKEITHLSIYKKRFSSGEIALGGNVYVPDVHENYATYVVVISEARSEE